MQNTTEITNGVTTHYTLILAYEKSGRRVEKQVASPAEAHAYASKRKAAQCTLYSESDRGSRLIETFSN